MRAEMTLTEPRLEPGRSANSLSRGPAVTHLGSAAVVVLLMLGSYMVLKPYYLLPSGLPQIADMLLVIAVPFTLLLPQVQLPEDAGRFRFCLVLFCFYAALVNVGWTFALMDPRVSLGATYYLFNLCLMVICLRIGTLHPNETFATIAYAIALSAAIQAVTAAFGYDSARLRQIASFNNPNQLGYWSLLSLCIFLCIARTAKIKWYVQATTVTCLVYTAAASLSKSAMIATALLCILHFVKKPKLLLIGLLALAPGYLVLEDSLLFERVSGRLQGIGEQEDDSLEARGFSRILEYPEYIMTGAGEGALYRFEQADNSGERTQVREIHSTFLTILFSYGLIGSAAFLAAIWRLYRLSSAGSFLYLLPPFFYGLTHQGLRFSLLWLLLAVIAVLSLFPQRNSTSSNAGATALRS